MIVNIVIQKYGWMELSFSCGSKYRKIHLSNVFDPFKNLNKIIIAVKDRKASKITIDEEGNEVYFSVKNFHEDFFEIEILSEDTDLKETDFRCKFNRTSFMEEMSRNLLKVSQDPQEEWSGSELYTIDWSVFLD